MRSCKQVLVERTAQLAIRIFISTTDLKSFILFCLLGGSFINQDSTVVLTRGTELESKQRNPDFLGSKIMESGPSFPLGCKLSFT